PELVERLEPHLRGVARAAAFHPGGPEPLRTPVDHGRSAALHEFRLPLPADAAGEDVVVGEGEKVVAAFAVPVGNHLGEVVAIAPEGVGVEVALPPANYSRSGRRG
ncbi:MAG: hypothetical protein ACK56I_32650, partial [bacterium]